MTTNTNDASKKRKSFSFSLRTLLLVVISITAFLLAITWFYTPRTFQGFYERGVKEFNDKNWKSACKSFSKAIEYWDKKDPYYIENDEMVFCSPYVLRGIALHNDGQYKSALNDLNYALNTEKYFIRGRIDFESLAFFTRAQTHLALGNLKEAKQDVQHVLQLTPANKDAINLYEEIEKLNSAATESER